MKKSDWAAIILIVALVGVASYFIVGAIMPSPADNLQSVPIATEITETVADPNEEVFKQVLDKYYDGTLDENTIEKLNTKSYQKEKGRGI